MLMADIRLITILPVPGVAQPAGVPSATTYAGPVIANFPTGSILSGFIVNRDPQGNPILRTDKGDIVFASRFFLKIGSEVVIRIENRAGHTQAHILSVNGQTPEQAEAQSAFAQDPEVIVGRETGAGQAHSGTTQSAQSFAAAIIRPVQTHLVSGTLLAAAPPVQGEPPAMPAGTQLILKLLTMQAAPAYATEATSIPASAAAAQPHSGAGQPAQANIPAAYTPYQKLAEQPAAAAAQPTPAHRPEAAPTALPGQTLAATIVTSDAGGSTLAHTPLGTVRLSLPFTGTPGNTLIFSIESIDMEPPVAHAPGQPETGETPLTELAMRWDSLKQMVSLLALANESFGQTIGQPYLPVMLNNPQQATLAPQQISAGLMLFIAALRGGDFRNWLGKANAQWLERAGHGELLKKAQGEFSTLAQLATQPATPGHWQALFFPLAMAGELHQVRFFTKRDRKQKQSPQQPDTDDTRFVVEVDMSQMGEIQMDGFIRRGEQQVQFDLMIRSLKPLEESVQSDILRIYTQTGEITGYRGLLLFQAVRQFPVNPMEELLTQHPGSVLA